MFRKFASTYKTCTKYVDYIKNKLQNHEQVKNIKISSLDIAHKFGNIANSVRGSTKNKTVFGKLNKLQNHEQVKNIKISSLDIAHKFGSIANSVRRSTKNKIVFGKLNKLQSHEQVEKIKLTSLNIAHKFGNIANNVKGNIVSSVKGSKKNKPVLGKLNQFKSDVKFRPTLSESILDTGNKCKNVYKTIQENETIQSAPERGKEILGVFKKKMGDISNSDIKINSIARRNLFTKGALWGINIIRNFAWQRFKIKRELVERRQLDKLQFQKAGKGPTVKTFKYNPTKVLSLKGAGAINEKNK